MANMEMRPVRYTPSTAPTILNPDENELPIVGNTHLSNNAKSDRTVLQNQGDNRDGSSDDTKALFGFSFDVDLRTSRPYMRAMKRQSLFSPRSSAIGTVGWSCLSGFSLANVSELSVVNLPISAKELWNGQRYSNSHIVIKSILEDIREEGICCEYPTQSESRMGSISRIGSMSHPLITNYIKSERQPLKAVIKLLKGNESPERGWVRTPAMKVGESGLPVATLPKKIVLLGKSSTLSSNVNYVL